MRSCTGSGPAARGDSFPTTSHRGERLPTITADGGRMVLGSPSWSRLAPRICVGRTTTGEMATRGSSRVLLRLASEGEDAVALLQILAPDVTTKHLALTASSGGH